MKLHRSTFSSLTLPNGAKCASEGLTFLVVIGVLSCCSAKKKEAITATACVVLELLGSSLFMATSTEVRVIPSLYVHARFRPCHGKIFGFVSPQNFVVSSQVRGLEEMDLFIS